MMNKTIDIYPTTNDQPDTASLMSRVTPGRRFGLSLALAGVLAAGCGGGESVDQDDPLAGCTVTGQESGLQPAVNSILAQPEGGPAAYDEQVYPVAAELATFLIGHINPPTDNKEALSAPEDQVAYKVQSISAEECRIYEVIVQMRAGDSRIGDPDQVSMVDVTTRICLSDGEAAAVRPASMIETEAVSAAVMRPAAMRQAESMVSCELERGIVLIDEANPEVENPATGEAGQGEGWQVFTADRGMTDVRKASSPEEASALAEESIDLFMRTLAQK